MTQEALADKVDERTYSSSRRMGEESANRVLLEGNDRLHQPNGFIQEAQPCIRGDDIGTLGSYEFGRPNGMQDFTDFKNENSDDYYFDKEEPALLRRVADVCASLVKKELEHNGKPLKVTFVSRGPGFEFLNKEGELVKAFQRAGIEVEKVVLVDFSTDALKKSISDVKEFLPDAEIDTVQADIFSRKTKNKIRIKDGTTEVSSMFGGTPCNLNGLKKGGDDPEIKLTQQLSDIRFQQDKGAFLFAVYDHNPDKVSNEQSYAGRTKMVRGFFKECFGVADTNSIQYKPEYDEDNHIIYHNASFDSDVSYYLGKTKKIFERGLSWCFNVSFKPSKDAVITANRNARYSYPNVSRHPEFSDIALMGADGKRLGMHAVIANGGPK